MHWPLRTCNSQLIDLSSEALGVLLKLHVGVREGFSKLRIACEPLTVVLNDRAVRQVEPGETARVSDTDVQVGAQRLIW